MRQFLIIGLMLGASAVSRAQKETRFFSNLGTTTPSGIITQKQLLAEAGIHVYVMVNNRHALSLAVDSMSVMIVRDSSIIFKRRVAGKVFNESVKEAFRRTIAGDRVFFYEIVAYAADESRGLADPLAYLIKKDPESAGSGQQALLCYGLRAFVIVRKFILDHSAKPCSVAAIRVLHGKKIKATRTVHL